MASNVLWRPKGYTLTRTTIAGAGAVSTTLINLAGIDVPVRLMNIFVRAQVNTLAANTGFVRIFHFVATQAASFLLFERNISGLAAITIWEYYSNRLMDKTDQIIIQDVNTGAVNAAYNVTLHTEEYQ